MSIASIPYVIPVLSGKGGVGKSSVTVQLALSLALLGHNVAVLDVDLTGPSIPRLFGIESSKIRQAPGGWLPVEVHGAREGAPSSTSQNDAAPNGSNDSRNSRPKLGSLHCMSLGFLLKDRGDAVIWRGPKKTAMVKQLLSDVLWPANTRFLLVDTPPGTSDEHISLITNLTDPARSGPTQKLGAVIVTTPQAIATADVRKELSFCKKTNLPVLGVVENMAGYVCPCCGEITNVFSKGGGQVMADAWGVDFLGSAPLDGEGWGQLVEERRRPVYTSPDSKPNEALNETAPEATPAAPGADGGETMADMYTSCSLSTIFADVARQLVPFEARLPTEPAA